MPLLPWKKAKVTRISQLVADLQSPKHGGSLVVQTGFPNSLIDLFVKNRDRLKTKPPSIKKHNTNKNKTKIKKKKNINSIEVSDPEILPPASPPPPPPPSNYVDSVCFWGPAVSRIESHGCRQSCAGAGGGDVDGDLVVDDDHVVVVADVEKDHVKRSGSSGVFVAILKMLILIAVVVAMATKKLAVGITLSAFVLLFIEYAVGKQTVCYFESYSKTLANLRFLIRRDRIADFEQPCAVMIKEGGLDFNHDGAAIEEIEIEGNKTGVVVVQHDQKIRATEADLDTLNRDKRIGYEETTIRKLIMAEEYEDGVGESIEQKKRRRNRSAKFKAKMKKLVPNKYRDSKKEKNCKERVPAEVPSICHDHENGLGKEIEIDENNSSHSLSEQKQCANDQEEKIGGEVRHSSRIIMMAAATSIGSKKMGMEKKRNLRSLVLILLILAGLVGGRAVAVVLTFGWWLCLKSVATLKRRSNVPMIRGLLSKLSQE